MVGKQLQMLHKEGYVHQQLTSVNVRLVQFQNCRSTWMLYGWWLLRKIGAAAMFAFDVGLAPEVLGAILKHEGVFAHPAQDVFGLAFVIFSCIAEVSVFCWGQYPMTLDQVCAVCLHTRMHACHAFHMIR